MFDYLKGNLAFFDPTKVVLDVGGIGYRLLIPIRSYSELPSIGTFLQLFTSLVIREDAHTLFGFLKQQERDLFEILITLSGVGPKTALALIGHLDYEHFYLAISENNLPLLHKVPGIGKKTAERLVIEMRDKLKILDKSYPVSSETKDRKATDALQALIHLGYPTFAAQKAVKTALLKAGANADTAQIISLALRQNLNQKE
jgi:holliday junction DNA helicase RuvA